MGILDEPEVYKEVFVNSKKERNLTDSQLASAGSQQKYQKCSDERRMVLGNPEGIRKRAPGEFDGQEQGARHSLEVKESVQALVGMRD